MFVLLVALEAVGAFPVHVQTAGLAAVQERRVLLEVGCATGSSIV
jgi:hypothetical protein